MLCREDFTFSVCEKKADSISALDLQSQANSPLLHFEVHVRRGSLGMRHLQRGGENGFGVQPPQFSRL